MTHMQEVGDGIAIPTEHSHAADDAAPDGIRAAGDARVHCGLITLGALRMKNGDRHVAVDSDNTDTPVPAGLGFAVDFTKPDFIGRAALMALKAARPSTHPLVQFLRNNPEPPMQGTGPILCDGAHAGYVRAAAFGPTRGASVGRGIVAHRGSVTAEFLRAHHVDTETADTRAEVTPSRSAVYAPPSAHVRA